MIKHSSLNALVTFREVPKAVPERYIPKIAGLFRLTTTEKKDAQSENQNYTTTR
jgi:hypothetical protein